MNPAEKFLKDKGLLTEGHTKFDIKFSDGRQYELTELLEEYRRSRICPHEWVKSVAFGGMLYCIKCNIYSSTRI